MGGEGRHSLRGVRKVGKGRTETANGQEGVNANVYVNELTSTVFFLCVCKMIDEV